MKEFKVLKCNHCGKTVVVLSQENIPTICCGEPMAELIPNTTDASNEKHVPVVTRNDGSLIVEVGSVEHPMTPEHLIEWVALVSEGGFRIEYLEPQEKPVVKFLGAEKATEVYAYCNLHGLWKTSI